MKSENDNKNQKAPLPKQRAVSLAKYICFAAVFTALTAVGTMIAVPLPFGYFNLGDVFLLAAAWCLGPIYGTVAAGLGSALADLFLGYTVYAPATLFIKSAVAISAYFLHRVFRSVFRRSAADFWTRILAAILAETLMIAGYFFFESVLLGYGFGATASLLGNGLQALCGALGGALLTTALRSVKRLNSLFPHLSV